MSKNSDLATSAITCTPSENECDENSFFSKITFNAQSQLFLRIQYCIATIILVT